MKISCLVPVSTWFAKISLNIVYFIVKFYIREIVVYNWFFCGKSSGKTAPTFLFTWSTPMSTSVFQDRSFLFGPPLFPLSRHSPSLQKASRSNPHPTFLNCMQSDVMSVSFCLLTFRKKTIVYYWNRFLSLFHLFCLKAFFQRLWFLSSSLPPVCSSLHPDRYPWQLSEY